MAWEILLFCALSCTPLVLTCGVRDPFVLCSLLPTSRSHLWHERSFCSVLLAAHLSFSPVTWEILLFSALCCSPLVLTCGVRDPFVLCSLLHTSRSHLWRERSFCSVLFAAHLSFSPVAWEILLFCALCCPPLVLTCDVRDPFVLCSLLHTSRSHLWRERSFCSVLFAAHLSFSPVTWEILLFCALCCSPLVLTCGMRDPFVLCSLLHTSRSHLWCERSFCSVLLAAHLSFSPVAWEILLFCALYCSPLVLTCGMRDPFVLCSLLLTSRSHLWHERSFCSVLFAAHLSFSPVAWEILLFCALSCPPLVLTCDVRDPFVLCSLLLTSHSHLWHERSFCSVLFAAHLSFSPVAWEILLFCALSCSPLVLTCDVRDPFVLCSLLHTSRSHLWRERSFCSLLFAAHLSFSPVAWEILLFCAHSCTPLVLTCGVRDPFVLCSLLHTSRSHLWRERSFCSVLLAAHLSFSPVMWEILLFCALSCTPLVLTCGVRDPFVLCS